ncbi:MAG: efflux RND transporter permease subunit [Myxococcota bacterium]|nr:efflux RND transporter permease subunit [Myxococcota bacterium]
MNLGAVAIEKRVVVYFSVFILAVGGVASFFQLGQLEDPDFTVKTAVVTTRYPGASPLEVELEVTDRVERALQELTQLDSLYSESRAGLSLITVDIKPEYWADRLPQVWDELRNKVGDVEAELPPGAEAPIVSDDFSFVYGFVLAVTGDGFSLEELEHFVKSLRKDLALVPGVSRAELWGNPYKVIYVDTSLAQLATLGLTPENIALTLRDQNLVVDAGSIDYQNRRFRVAPTGAFTSPDEIGDLAVTASIAGKVATILPDDGSDSDPGVTPTGEIVRIRDVATVSAGLYQPPPWEMRVGGEPAIGISLANVAGGNVVETGRNLDRRLDELVADLPIGIEVHKVAWQSDLVTDSIQGFLFNLVQAIGIVLVVLTVPMGWRMGVIIGSALVLTILGTFILMSVFEIDLQRMSLGALVIALGMMVDNAIVVADGIFARMQRGMDRKQAAIEVTGSQAWPLLGATLVAVMAFYPIFASTADAGEYCRTLFSVVGIALLLSWLVAMTITPLQSMDLLVVDEGAKEADAYGGRLYTVFRSLLKSALRQRLPFVGAMVGLLVASVVGFGGVEQMFFPDSSRNQIMIDYWGPQGTRTQDVSQGMRPVEERFMTDERVVRVSSFVGQGPPRFYLPVDPEAPNENYGQIIVETHDYREINGLIEEITPWLAENVPDAMVRVRKFGVGPSETWPFEARFHGPAEADLQALRRLGQKGLEITQASPLAKDVRVDMRERVAKMVPRYDQERGRWTGITREDIGRSTKRTFDGVAVGLYREGDDLYPILLRQTEPERERAAEDLEQLPIQSVGATHTVPLAAVAQLDSEWEDPIIIRHNRRRAITVQAAARGTTFPQLKAAVVAELEAIELPPGFKLYWDGEDESTRVAQASLIPGVIPAGVIILFIIVALFNAMRPPIIIVLVIPFAAIGITLGLLVTRAPFGFVALLGAMSLAGMMIKNAIVLLDQVGADIDAGKAPYDAIVDSAVSRLRPVLLAAATTVLGVVPLLGDVFWVSMSVVIMAGLSFGTVLTMILVPVLYAVFFKVPSPER